MRHIDRPTETRRDFLGVAAGSMALAAMGSLMPNVAGAAPSAALPDESWLAGIKGKHRVFFDAASVNDGFPFAFAMNFLNHYNQAYGVSDRDLTVVVGLRHFAIPLALSDGIWSKYHLGEFAKVNDAATKSPATHNPFVSASSPALLAPDMAFEKLRARGVVFTVCNAAMTVLSGMMGKGAGIKPEDAYTEWKAALLPGVHIVPAGVLAVNRAQEQGCTYCFAG